MTTLSEMFRHDDRVALFVVAMCTASNDVENALDQVDVTSALHGYYVRLALAHTVEGLSTYDIWAKEPDVKAFIATVDKKWRRNRKTVATMRHEVGSALGTARNHTFHYPAPGNYNADAELRKVLAAMADERAELTLISRGHGTPNRVRFDFADKAATMLALRKFTATDTDQLRNELEAAREGAKAFIGLVGWLFAAYAKREGLRLGEPEWEPEEETPPA